MDKKWYLSKTIWVNAIAIAAGFLADKFGIQIDSVTQVTILGIINLILRIVTKEEITW